MTEGARTELSAELPKLSEHGPIPAALEYLWVERGAALSRRTLLYLLHRMYGADEVTLRQQLERLINMGAKFAELYGDGPVSILRVPARINILGEHVDYVSYLPTASLPFGSREYDMLMLYRAVQIGSVRGASSAEGYPRFSFSFDDAPSAGAGGEIEAEWLSYLYEKPTPSPHWSNYLKAATYFARLKWGEQVRHGFDFLVDSRIPPGGGASSSSALVVLGSAAVHEVNRLEWSPLELARDAAKSEWFVGTRGGSMDHITMCLAKRHHALLITYPEQLPRQVTLPGRQFRWVTFFSHAAAKGRAVMIEYNERAAVSRILIPAVIERWKTKRPELHAAWLNAVQSLRERSREALDQLDELLGQLPYALTLTEVERDYPEAFTACALAFPALVEERRDHPLQVQARARHHVGEVRRVIAAVEALENLAAHQNDPSQLDSAMRALGVLLDESHESLRDLYGVSTAEVERLFEIIRSDRNVYGAHIMGGGFGGNILALTRDDNVASLIERVQATYYEPQRRQGVLDGAVMISTPGDGLANVDLESVWREAIEQFNSSTYRVAEFRSKLTHLLDNIRLDATTEEVWPVIVAAGKGTRARATGLEVPKPLAPVLGEAAIVNVLRSIRAALGNTRPPIVIISPETESGVRAALAGEAVTFVLQPEALGTGDAVLCAHEQLKDFRGRTLIVWSTQPVIRPETILRTSRLAALFSDCAMVVPTAYQDHPYAPLLRDELGRVREARETRLEAERPGAGESNIGLFLLKNEPMLAALAELKQRYWDPLERRYRRNAGELGFPNELINYFAGLNASVFASPIADSREEQGIKNLQDVARCEQFISELQQENS